MASGNGNPEPRYCRYIENLIGPATVTCLPLEAFGAYRFQVPPSPRLEENLTEAYTTLELLSEVTIKIDEFEDRLEQETIKGNLLLFDKVLAAIGDTMADGATVGS
jgi:hypothetical protein